MKEPVHEGSICGELGWWLTSVVYTDTTGGPRPPATRVFYVEHDCDREGQSLSFKPDRDNNKLKYIVCNRCGGHCPETIFNKFVFLRAMNE